MEEDAFQEMRDGYYRIQGGSKFGLIDLADVTKLDEIEKLSEEYMTLNEGKLRTHQVCREASAEKLRSRLEKGGWRSNSALPSQQAKPDPLL
ncbi:hypothetical protein HD806DRAFT_488904 [Xylariaceae sp. AK1471]|nr:hypothetical protein HD806DRAFT_488904 [Xylariaceae sp. AK1471]